MKCRGILPALTLAALIWGGARAEADLLVVERGDADVLRFPEGSNTPVTFATANLDSPIGIDVDASRNVYVVNHGASDSVVEFSPTGSPQGFFVSSATPPGNTLNAPTDIAFDGGGNAYVTSGTAPNPPYGYIAEFNHAGQFQTSFGLSSTNMPTGIGYNPTNGLLYAVNGATTGDAGPNLNSILIYNPANLAAPTIITPTGAGALDGAQQIAFNPSTGNVFIASSGAATGISRIQEFSASGIYIATIDSRAGGNAQGVAYDPTTGTLYASFLGGASNPSVTSGFIESYASNGNSFRPGVTFASNLNLPEYLAVQAVVPEPTSVVLMGLGLITLAGFHARRRGRVSPVACPPVLQDV